MQVTRNVKDVRMPMELVHEVLVKAGRLEGCQKKEEEAKVKKNASISTTGVLRVMLSKSVQTSLS